MGKCAECNKETKNPRFCSRSCSAAFNNKQTPKRKKHPKTPRICRECKEELPLDDEFKFRKLCDKCRDSGIKGYSYVRKSRKFNKERLAEEIGKSKCKRCGYNTSIEALEFHHLDDTTKNFTISSNMNKAYESLLKEAKKCIVLCANCHRELHAGVWKIDKL